MIVSRNIHAQAHIVKVHINTLAGCVEPAGIDCGTIAPATCCSCREDPLIEVCELCDPNSLCTYNGTRLSRVSRVVHPPLCAVVLCSIHTQRIPAVRMCVYACMYTEISILVVCTQSALMI
jgi:hypothetical protein